MRWRRKQDRWYLWFALFPVLVGDTWVWLEWYQYKFCGGGVYLKLKEK